MRTDVVLALSLACLLATSRFTPVDIVVPRDTVVNQKAKWLESVLQWPYLKGVSTSNFG